MAETPEYQPEHSSQEYTRPSAEQLRQQLLSKYAPLLESLKNPPPISTDSPYSYRDNRPERFALPPELHQTFAEYLLAENLPETLLNYLPQLSNLPQSIAHDLLFNYLVQQYHLRSNNIVRLINTLESFTINDPDQLIIDFCNAKMQNYIGLTLNHLHGLSDRTIHHFFSAENTTVAVIDNIQAFQENVRTGIAIRVIEYHPIQQHTKFWRQSFIHKIPPAERRMVLSVLIDSESRDTSPSFVKYLANVIDLLQPTDQYSLIRNAISRLERKNAIAALYQTNPEVQFDIGSFLMSLFRRCSEINGDLVGFAIRADQFPSVVQVMPEKLTDDAWERIINHYTVNLYEKQDVYKDNLERLKYAILYFPPMRRYQVAARLLSNEQHQAFFALIENIPQTDRINLLETFLQRDFYDPEKRNRLTAAIVKRLDTLRNVSDNILLAIIYSDQPSTQEEAERNRPRVNPLEKLGIAKKETTTHYSIHGYARAVDANAERFTGPLAQEARRRNIKLSTLAFEKLSPLLHSPRPGMTISQSEALPLASQAPEPIVQEATTDQQEEIDYPTYRYEGYIDPKHQQAAEQEWNEHVQNTLSQKHVDPNTSSK